ncbi:MAG: hypothetical protein HFG54_14280 [Lachnospiraceae bacterium]|nr:hypothetical protein [Lachnospiraceae bacterium]
MFLMAKETWLLNPETKDLVFDAEGILSVIEDEAADIQQIWMVLQTWKGDFNLVPNHGTDYERILGEPEDEDTADEIIREAVFQEPDVSSLDEIFTEVIEKRALEISISGTLKNGASVSMEVGVNG